ncbi:MAG TPA: hypothetical protein VF084_03235 [Nitrososphaeraceae archaeon]
MKQEFIRGNIDKDQNDILKENIADVLKSLVSKKTDNNAANDRM